MNISIDRKENNIFEVKVSKKYIDSIFNYYNDNLYLLETKSNISFSRGEVPFIVYSNTMNKLLITCNYNLYKNKSRHITALVKVADCRINDFMKIIDDANKNTGIKRIGA